MGNRERCNRMSANLGSVCLLRNNLQFAPIPVRAPTACCFNPIIGAEICFQSIIVPCVRRSLAHRLDAR